MTTRRTILEQDPPDDEQDDQLDLDDEPLDDDDDEASGYFEGDDDEEEEDQDDLEDEDDDEEGQRGTSSRREQRQPRERSIEAIQRAYANNGALYEGELARLKSHQQSIRQRLNNEQQARGRAVTAFRTAQDGIVSDVTEMLREAKVQLPEGVVKNLARAVGDRFRDVEVSAFDASTAALHVVLDQTVAKYVFDPRRVQQIARMPIDEKMEEVAALIHEDGKRQATAKRPNGQKREGTPNGRRGAVPATEQRRRITAPPSTRRSAQGVRRLTDEQLENGYAEGTLSPSEEQRYLARRDGRPTTRAR